KELTDVVKKLKVEENTLIALESEVNQKINYIQAPVTSSGNTLATLSSSNSGGGSAPKSTVNTGGLIGAAKSQLGTRYRTAGKGPGGFDCSGFVSWAYRQTGKSIPSSTASLRNMGQRVSIGNAQPGDLIFFDTVGRDGHVGIYLGNGQFIGS